MTLIDRLRNLFTRKPMTVEEARDAARKAVIECRAPFFAIENEAIPEGSFTTVEDYQRVIRNPASFFMCKVCGVTSGPWHHSWSKSWARTGLGPCCTGADYD